jgi:hypothetical protein
LPLPGFQRVLTAPSDHCGVAPAPRPTAHREHIRVSLVDRRIPGSALPLNPARGTYLGGDLFKGSLGFARDAVAQVRKLP